MRSRAGIVPSDGSPEVVVTGAIGDGGVAQRQRGRSQDSGWRAWVALADQHVEDDVIPQISSSPAGGSSNGRGPRSWAPCWMRRHTA